MFGLTEVLIFLQQSSSKEKLTLSLRLKYVSDCTKSLKTGSLNSYFHGYVGSITATARRHEDSYTNHSYAGMSSQ